MYELNTLNNAHLKKSWKHVCYMQTFLLYAFFLIFLEKS